jgi:hypothetical protein
MTGFASAGKSGGQSQHFSAAKAFACLTLIGSLIQPIQCQQYRGWEFHGEYEGVGYYTRFLEQKGSIVFYEVKLSNFRGTAVDAINCRDWTSWQNSTSSWEQIYPETVADVLGKRYCKSRPKPQSPDA